MRRWGERSVIGFAIEAGSRRMPTAKKRDCVYVIGAGFSAGLGYPLTHDLLVRLWGRPDKSFMKSLEKVIKFHHSYFDRNRFTTFPNVEQLLTEILINPRTLRC
jgi:hypothetical protein